jgi:hypothetical protein
MRYPREGMDFAFAMQAYFAGEKLTGIVFACYGALLLGAALGLQRVDSGPFAWGFIVPIGIVGLAGLVGGSILAWKTGPQVEALASLYGQDVDAFLAQELPRMRKVNANWPRLEAAWTVIIVAALAVIWSGWREWATGLALALLVAAASAMVLDVFAERRARVYTTHLEALGPAPAS